MGERGQDEAIKFAADMYDAVGAVWLETFGEHVHVGEYLLTRGAPDTACQSDSEVVSQLKVRCISDTLVWRCF
jgi:hypothetical protein